MRMHCLLLALEALKWPSENINVRRSVSIFRHHCLHLLWSCYWRDFSIDTMPQDPPNSQHIFVAVAALNTLSRSRDIARYRSNSPILLHINQPAYFMERNMEYFYISRITQCTNTGRVPACTKEPVDSTDANIVETSTCWRQYNKKRQISPSDYWSNRTGPCSAAPLSVQSSYRYQNILQIGQVLGHHIDAKISPKAAS